MNTIEPDIIGLSEYADNNSEYSAYEVDEPPIFMFSSFSNIKDSDVKNNIKITLNDDKYRPSTYMQCRSLSLKEKLFQLSYINTIMSYKKKPKIGEKYLPEKIKIIDLIHDPDVVNHSYDVPIDTPIFQPFPSQIVLQNFIPFEKYNIIISFRNNDKFARKMKILPINYPYFSIRGINSASLNSEKIAPGMEVQYIITFVPEENIDYNYNLVCITEREKFLVPMIAIGARAILDFPDMVNFSECPVNYESSKILLIRNIGNKSATFKLTVNEPFKVVPSDGYLDIGESMQIEVKFEPEKVGSYEGEMLLEYDTGEEVYINVYGSADDVNIRLEKQILQMDNTYINLVSMKVLTLYNRSDIIIKYQWKQFSSQIEENQFRERKIIELNQLREEEELYIRENETNPEVTNQKIALINEKYKNLIKEKENEEFLFYGKCISITPQEGTIWPNSSSEFRILFQPEKSIEYKRTIYCCVNGRETRLPLQIKGNGIGPKARFSFDQLEIEDVFINTIHKFQAYLENKGDIDVKFKLLPKNTLFGPKFSFSPDIGVIKAGNKQPIDIIFNPDILGEFYEDFLWNIEGSSNAISLVITGKVIGPTFFFEPNILNFGTSVYGFLNTRTIKLVNTSDITISYRLRLVSDNSEDANEFNIIPEIGTVLPISEKEIKVNFTPNRISNYKASIMVDIEHIGNDVMEYHIEAESIVPDIVLNTVTIDYEKCYQGYPYTKTIELYNPSNYPARYRLIHQEESAKIVYSYESLNGFGIINPNSNAQIDLTIIVKKLGTVVFPVFIEIIGKYDVNLVVDITAYGIGPTISLSTEEINWGKIKVLENNTTVLEINNNSPIPAKFECNTVNGNSIYTISKHSDIIQPYSKYPLTITAFLDDSVKFTDTLKIDVKSDKVHNIKLISQGIGTTIVFPEDFTKINFGDVFSNRKCFKTFKIKNCGRRTHTLHWLYRNPPQPKNHPKEDYQSIFTIIPQRVVLASGETCELTIEGYSKISKFYCENYICQGVIDKNPTRFDLIESVISVNFINPLISIKPSSLDFESIHKNENDFEIQEKSLELSNDSSLILHTKFIYEKPFDLIVPSNPLELKPGISIPVKIKFDSSYFKNKISDSKNCKLTLEYLEHPQIDTIDLNYNVLFPNLYIDITECKFDCIPQNTTIKKAFTILNKGKLPVYYTWNFFKVPFNNENDSIDTENELVPIYQLFDIIPLRGYLEPGACENSEIVFHGLCNGIYKVLAVCDVIGGPKYKIVLSGETSVVSYKFDREVVDFGVQYYQNIVKQDITLFNNGKVEFDYSIILPKNSIINKRVSIYPADGSILPNQKQKITIRFSTITPEDVEDSFFIRIAHFDPIPIKIIGKGIAPHIMINLPKTTEIESKISNENLYQNTNDLDQNCNNKGINPNGYFEEEEEEDNNNHNNNNSSNINNYNKSESNLFILSKDQIKKIKECERELLTTKTMEYFDMLYSDNKQKSQTPSKLNFVGSSILMSKTIKKKSNKKLNSNEINYLSELSKIHSTEYTCDFGYVIRNTTKTKKIIITNIGQKKVSFSFNITKLKNTGLSIEPEKVKELPPEESFEFYLTFQSRDISLSEKEVSILLPIEIVDGPVILINMKASLTIPEIKIKNDELNFGEVICGQRKSIAIQLFNDNSIQADWKIKQKITKNKAFSKNKTEFTIENLNSVYKIIPTSGSIQPGKNQLIYIKFEPTEEIDYNTSVILKTAMNSKSIILHLNGTGIQNKLEFQPERLCFDPVLPYADIVEKKFSIYNPNEYPIEVYSRDFDTIYSEEKKILQRIENYENNVVYLPPREIGQPITESYLESVNIKLKPAINENDENKEILVNPPEEGVGEIETIVRKRSIVSENSPIVFIVYGTPFSGKTTVSKSIAKRYNFLYLNINDIAENFLSIHNIINESKTNINSIQVSESSIPLSNTNINNSSIIEESRNGSSIDIHENSHYNRIIPDEKFIDAIKTRLLKEDCKNGVVIDGIDSKYATNAIVILKGIMKACPNKSKRVFINLITDLNNIHLREIQMKQKNNNTDPISEISLISEDEYDKLNPDEQKKYDIMLKNYKKQKRLLRDQVKLEKKKQVEIEQQKSEKRIDDEKNKKRERNKSFLVQKNISKDSNDKGKEIKEVIQDKGVLQSFIKTFTILKSLLDGRRSVSPQFNKKKDEKDKEKDKEKENNNKDKDKNDKEKMDKNDKEKIIENEVIANIDMSNLTIKKCENYTSTMDLIMVVLKEGEKFSHNIVNTNNNGNGTNSSYNNKQNQGLSFNEKRINQQRNKSDMVTTQTVESSNDSELKDEYLFGHYFEINSNLSIDETFEAIINNIPSTLDPEKLKNEKIIKELIPKIEQVINYPEDIPEEKEDKYNFFLINTMQDEEKSEISLTEITPQVSITTKPETSKKGKLTQKQVEEQKITEKSEEDVEKELAQKYRWIIKPGKKKDLIVRFNSKVVGTFTRNLSFSIVGSNYKYNIDCIGQCEYSQIETDYTKLFQKYRKTKDDKSLSHCEFIANTSTFEFGPLLYNKPKEKNIERYIDNKTTLNIINPSNLLTLNVDMCFKNDIKSEIFIIDPPSVVVGPGEMKQVSVSAFPKSLGLFEDEMVISIKDNPEPLCYKFSCIGVKPELELDKKVLSFDKIHIMKTENRQLVLKNISQISAYWKLSGIEQLGDEIKIAPVEGIIEYGKECVVNAEFHGSKVTTIKRSIKLEVSDVERINNSIQTENILVTAEAYEALIDFHPKNSDAIIDFGILGVQEEGKQQYTLKNKGKYEAGFNFSIKDKELSECLTFVPNNFVLQPNDKPFNVQILFKSKKEISFKDNKNNNIVEFQVYDPADGDITSRSTVKIIAKAVYSKFNIYPAKDLNFGASIHGTKGTKQFTIENTGEFDFRFNIYSSSNGNDNKQNNKKLNNVGNITASTNINSKPSKFGRLSPPPSAFKQFSRKDNKQNENSDLGPFSIVPTTAMVSAGSKQIINVDFHPETPGVYDEDIVIEIIDRVPESNIISEYKLTGESCLPGINIKDFNSIFEEHTVCKRLELFKVQNNVYAEEDRVFYFGALLTGLHSQARFKISNPYKIPCDVSLSLKPRGKSSKNDSSEFPFELEPKKINIPSYEYKYVTITFHPTSIQSYSGIFEAIVENVGDIKGRNLQFEIRGEGTLPRFIIEKPTIKNKQGVHILKFKKLIVGASQTLPILLKNVGIIEAKVKLEWVQNDENEFSCQDINSYKTLKINETAYIEVKCSPKSIGPKYSQLRIKTIDNNFEDTVISMECEGYLQDYVFENFPDDLSDEIQFKDCYINSLNQLSFTVFNRSQDLIKAKWENLEMFKFSPSVFHLSKNSRKNITVSFNSSKPINISEQIAKCTINKIKYSNINQITENDWDDHITTVKWVTSTDPFSTKGQSFKKVLEKLPEPTNEIIPNTEFIYQLKLAANADYVSYECDVDSIKFKSTMMYQTRAYKFMLKNIGTIKMDYSFVFIDEKLGEVLDENNDDFPFSVEPENGSIEANDSALITVRFTPNDVYDYQCTLYCNIQNLMNDEKPLLINISGSSLRPFCHFELDECEYITNDHHHPDLVNVSGEPIVFDPLTKVLSFNSCGVKIRNSKRFYIVNTTQISYDFEWVCIAGNDKIFKCLTKKGRILSGKKFEINFEYIPENIDQRESLWMFRIKDSEISVPFLLVGQAMEPNIYMDRASINFNSILVGHLRKETINLVNSENTPFNFAFIENNLNKELTSTVKYSPVSGVIQPHSEVPIEVIFSPLEEKLYNICLICNVKKKPTPVKVNIRGEGYEIHEKLISEISDNNIISLTPGDKAENIIDFGRVYINEKHVKKIIIKNTGKFNIEYSWKSIISKYSNILSIVPEVGTVIKGEKVVCEIIFSPNNNIKLKNVKASCSIINGNTYNLKIRGIGCCPLLSIDKPFFDFGVNYINQQNSKNLFTTFQIINNDTREISFEIIPPTDPAFEVTNDLTCLLPNEESTITVYFNPTEVREYKDQINIEINGYISQSIFLTGEGSEVRVELVNSDLQKISFGAVNMNSVNTKIVKIRNRGVIPATFTIGPSLALESLITKYVTINYENIQITSNQNEITMKPKDIISIEVNFLPKQRVLAFDEDIVFDFNSFKKKLFSISGVCQGIDIKLENSILSFGPVVQHSSTIRKLNIQNVGDIGTRFSWDTSKFYPDFTINPSEGYISPGIDIPIEITFHPQNVQSEIRYENLICNIEHYHPLKLTLVGSCIVQPIQSEILKFSCPVRQVDVKSVIIQNKTQTIWNISPIIENNSWSGQDSFEVEPGQSKSYDVTFKPLEMNGKGENGRHEGSIFFPLPDGSGLLYKLSGIAEKPVSSGIISRDVPCKTNYSETLSISNWMKRSQRFKVSFELLKPDPAIIVKGKEYIDIPGLVERKYKVNFYSYKEGTANIKVIFKNETTQEYIFYNLNIRSTPAGVISTIEMSTTARVSILKEIVISNPLSTIASFVTSCNSSEISCLHSFQIQPRSDYKLQIEYLPLIPKEVVSNLTLNSSELGVYLYDLKLSCSNASLERKLQFKVPLGLNQVQTFRFLSYTKTKTEYSCKIDSPDFTVDKTVIAPSAQNGGVEVCVDITYEPSKLGDIRSTLVVSSPIGGDYICPLFGHCVIPRPQGPILVKSGTASSVIFKNVFTTQAAFNYSIDNPAFTIKATDTIGSKKVCNMLINFKPINPNQNSISNNSVSGASQNNSNNSKPSTNNNSNNNNNTINNSIINSNNNNNGNNNNSNNNNNITNNNNNCCCGSSSSNNSNCGSNSSCSCNNYNGNSTYNSRVSTPSKIGKLTITHQSGVSWVYYLKGMT
ncbi:hypothetical protein BCR36DRAFT_329786 [Piromyces finnis]|uniref:MSP domain-containing protein n=1 Tax=Piromyces finnis TaxID=1754191 RepID=A0A1Y1V650_9FUNG|nr:hypothetical protein BCR36DRAFT_329786 [Piromyces finnis]|eukprot:ORX48158.1 hypothetical protein BCR36DRAFT_329786 [Piromyces finnis]